jgi:hypothetical protein
VLDALHQLQRQGRTQPWAWTTAASTDQDLDGGRQRPRRATRDARRAAVNGPCGSESESVVSLSNKRPATEQDLGFIDERRYVNTETIEPARPTGGGADL